MLKASMAILDTQRWKPVSYSALRGTTTTMRVTVSTGMKQRDMITMRLVVSRSCSTSEP